MACELFGYEENQLVGRPLKDLLRLKSKEQEVITETHLEPSGQIVSLAGKVVCSFYCWFHLSCGVFNSTLLPLVFSLFFSVFLIFEVQLVLKHGTYLSELLHLYSPSRSLRSSSLCSKSNTSTTEPMAFALSHTLAPTSGTISPKTSGNLLLSLPSKANWRHFSSHNISVKPHCPSLLSVCTGCACIFCIVMRETLLISSFLLGGGGG